MQNRFFIMLIMAGLLTLGAACSSSGESVTTDENRDRCVSAADCPGGRLGAICYAGLCYTTEEYCDSDVACVGSCLGSVCDDQGRRLGCASDVDCGGSRDQYVCSPEGYCFETDEYCTSSGQCVGECVDHVCEGGQNPNPVDGDVDEEEEGQRPCEYACCNDNDCVAGESICDTVETHECVPYVPCEPQYQCCQDLTCLRSAQFGQGYQCMNHQCVNPDVECPWACCRTADCPSGSICKLTEGADGYGTCMAGGANCTPGDEICCYDDAGNPECNSLGDLKSEAILTCNADGSDYDLSMCPEFNDCAHDQQPGTTKCLPNGRCGTDADCDCPKKCLDVDEGKRCMVPLAEQGEACWAPDPCGTGSPGRTAECTGDLICTVNQETNEGTCEVQQ